MQAGRVVREAVVSFHEVGYWNGIEGERADRRLWNSGNAERRVRTAA